MWLKQSTAATIKLGPFVDSTDGVTAETALTIAQADIRLSKNGGDIAQTNNATGATHDELGYYDVPLDTTDTGTLGRLDVIVSESGALPVWRSFMVVPANVWDSMFGADKLQVDLTQINGVAQTATLDDIEAQTDDIGVAGAGLTAIPWNASWDAEVQSEVADALTAYDPPTNAEMEARTLASASYATAAALATVDSNVDAILVDTGTTLDGKIDTIDTVVDAIKAKTDSLTFTTANQVDANALAISGSTTAATNLEEGAEALVPGTCAASSTTTTINTNLTETTDDHYNGRVITFVSGDLTGQSTNITDYNGTTKALTVTALTEAPAENDAFVIS